MRIYYTDIRIITISSAGAQAQKALLGKVSIDQISNYSYNHFVNNLDGIEIYVKVIQSGSFTKASKLLGIPLTTVSGKVANLERRLGVTLIHRTTRKLNITKEGEAYFTHCLRALDEITTGEKELMTSKIEPEGLLRLTAPSDIGHILLPPIVRMYLKTYPKVKVELILTNRIVDLVGEGVDLAIRGGALEDSSLIARKFRNTHANLWASIGYIKKNGMPRNPKELTGHSFIGFSEYPGPLKLWNGTESVTVPIHPRILADDLETIKIFVMSGEGIGVLTPFVCENEILNKKIVKILPNFRIALGSESSQLSFVYPPQRFVPPKVQAFIELALS